MVFLPTPTPTPTLIPTVVHTTGRRRRLPVTETTKPVGLRRRCGRRGEWADPMPAIRYRLALGTVGRRQLPQSGLQREGRCRHITGCRRNRRSRRPTTTIIIFITTISSNTISSSSSHIVAGPAAGRAAAMQANCCGAVTGRCVGRGSHRRHSRPAAAVWRT